MKAFGEETREEKDAIRERLLASGQYEPGTTALFFAVERAWEKLKQGEPTYRERQSWWAMRRFMDAPKPRRRYFTAAEVDYLLVLSNLKGRPLIP